MSEEASLIPTLRLRSITVLRTSSVHEKARLTHEYAKWWHSLDRAQKQISGAADDGIETPDSPQRDVTEVRRGREKKAGAKGFVHSLAHAEGCAIDCFWDFIARFGREAVEALGDEAIDLADDVIEIAVDEATHFERLSTRLDALGLRYGDLSATDTLAASMADTKDDCLARLAVIHLVHEARGLDVYSLGKARLERVHDHDTVAVLERNYNDEIKHVRLMKHWFERLVKVRAAQDPRNVSPRDRYVEIVRDPRRWKQQGLKGPFNVDARTKAGMDSDWYLPLEIKNSSSSAVSSSTPTSA